MMRVVSTIVLLAGAGACCQPSSIGQDQPDPRKSAAAQKAAITANLKKADFSKHTVVETDNFFVVSNLPEEKARALGTALEKVVPLARKTLQFEKGEAPWPGKLAVYYLPDSRDFKSFMRSVAQVQPDSVHYELRGEEPYLVDPVDVGSKASEADQLAKTSSHVAIAYLKAKAGGSNVPGWFTEGFGRAVAARAEGVNSKRYTTYRNTARSLAAKGWKASDLWGETKPMNAELLSTSFLEFLAFGPMAKDFPRIVSGFRADENGNTPSVQTALEAGGWKDVAALDSAWKRWISSPR
jgi:hypothetical protein